MRAGHLVIGAAVVIGLTGCGIASTSDAVTGGRSADSASTADQELADDAMLRLSDFPAGWTQVEDPGDDGDDGFAETESCGSRPETGDAPGVSSDFARTTSQVSSAVAVYPNDALAEEAYAFFDSPDFGACFEESLRAESLEAVSESSGFAVEDVTVDETAGIGIGDEDLSLQVAVEGTGSGIGLTLYVDFDVVRVGRVLSVFMFLEIFDEFDRPLREELVATVADRLDQPGGFA